MKLIYACAASLIFIPLFILSNFTYGHSPKPLPPLENSTSSRRAVIVELFTSEGCSSCPPADALLKALSEQQPLPGTEIIALEEHVDYWNHLGWKDPFSSVEFTQRQDEYAKVFGNSGVYTPQMVVDGHTEFVGSREREAREVIQKSALQPKVVVQLIPSQEASNGNPSFDIKVSSLSNLPTGHQAELWVAIAEKGLRTDVKAGENFGEHLEHAAVVRTIYKSNSFNGSNDYQTHANLKLNPAWQRDNLSLVIFVVEKNSRKIIGAAISKL